MADLLALWLLGSVVTFGLIVSLAAISDWRHRATWDRFVDCVVGWSARVKRDREAERERLRRKPDARF